MDFIPFFAGPVHVFRGPAGDGRLSPVSRDDVAAVAVQVLSTPGAHDGRAHGLTGPELFTLAEAAERLSASTGEPYSYEADPRRPPRAARRLNAAPDSLHFVRRRGA